MSSNITICSRCGKRTPTYTLQNYGWRQELEGIWTCPECFSQGQSSQNRNFVTPRARRQQDFPPRRQPVLQRQNAINFRGPRRALSSNSAFNTWTNSTSQGLYMGSASPPLSPVIGTSSSAAAPGASQADMDISSDEFPIDEEVHTFAAPRSNSLSPSDFQDVSSVGVESSAAEARRIWESASPNVSQRIPHPPALAPSSAAAPASSRPISRTKTEAVRELEAQIAAAHSYDIQATSVNRAASSYDFINLEDTRVRDALNEKMTVSVKPLVTRPKNIVFQRDDGSGFVVIPISYLDNLLHNPTYLNSTLYKCYNVTNIQLRFSQNNILTRWNGSLKFINGRGILGYGYFLKNDLIAALRSGHRFFIYHVHNDIKIGPMISADLISWTTPPSPYQISEYIGNPMEPFDPLSDWTMNSNELSGRDEDMELEGAIHCSDTYTQPMITFVNVAIRGIGRQMGIDQSNILSHSRRSGASGAESKRETQQQTRKGGRRKKRKKKRKRKTKKGGRRKKRKTRRRKEKKKKKTRKKGKKKQKKTRKGGCFGRCRREQRGYEILRPIEFSSNHPLLLKGKIFTDRELFGANTEVNEMFREYYHNYSNQANLLARRGLNEDSIIYILEMDDGIRERDSSHACSQLCRLLPCHCERSVTGKKRELKLNEKNISDITPLAHLTNLEHLILSKNGISNISPLSNMPYLISLSLGRNQIVDISPLSELTNLQMLWLNANQIVDITPLSGLTKLEHLYMWGNQIVDITPLSGLINLQRLWLHDNEIVDITPLSGLTNLVRLNIGSNNITDIRPLEGLVKLQKLEINNNNISDVTPLARLNWLIELWISDNNIEDLTIISHLFLHDNGDCAMRFIRNFEWRDNPLNDESDHLVRRCERELRQAEERGESLRDWI